jgi:signal transduction histidine kinase
MIDLQTAPRSAFPWALEYNLRRLGPIYKVRNHFMSGIRWYFEADSVWFYRRLRHNHRVDEKYFNGDEALCDESLLEPFARLERPAIPRNVLLAPLKVNERLVGVVGVARKNRDFESGRGRALTRLSGLLAQELARRQDERLTHVLDRIKEKVVAELRPKDLAYQILNSLYELVHYDHSAALLIYRQQAGVVRVEAEKIVWTKAKSAFIGHEIQATEELVDVLRRRNLTVLHRDGDGNVDRRRLYETLDYHRGHGIPEPSSLFIAPLFFDDQLLGLLKIAGQKRLPFDKRDRAVVERFLPAAAVALRNVRVKLSLEKQAVRAEMRAGLVTLARAVAHDVNNAIGSILPLADQAREDLREGRVDLEALAQDLDVIMEKATLCKRIFANMLKAGSDRSGAGPVDINQLVKEMLPMLEAQALPRSTTLEVELAEHLPVIRFSRSHLERILWNLVTNAIEAMPDKGGRIVISTCRKGKTDACLTVEDDGLGIPAANRDKVLEPFFTTKENGTGLGLAICRSMAWQFGGNLEIESTPGNGTRVTVTLPAVDKKES